MSWLRDRWRPWLNTIINGNCRSMRLIRSSNASVSGFRPCSCALQCRLQISSIFVMGTGLGCFGRLGLSSGLRPWRPCGLVGFVLAATKSSLYYRPEVCKIYPLNLSISLSGGKESNSDSPSNGEWTGKSPTLNRIGWMPGSSCRSSLHRRALALS